VTGEQLRQARVPLSKVSHSYVRNLDDGLKEAGLRSLGKYLLTGRSTLYHGTSGSRARAILREGLKPGAKPGISERVSKLINADVRGSTPGAFASRNKSVAQNYGIQQELLSKGLPSGAEIQNAYMNAVMQGDSVKGLKDLIKDTGRLYYHLPGAIWRKGVLKASVPAHRVKMLANPEINVVPEGATALNRAIARIAKRPTYYRDAKIPGIPAKYIKGSPEYQHVSLQEMKEHFKRMRRQPGESAREALKNLFEVQGSPVRLRDIHDLAKNI